ncbi:MAG: 2-aminoethylphosphonate--pyruvate transaminase [Acidaminococcus sp.]|jgi:2-aminoethylphosphonate-pyruvate transaminase|nr:2-aminoethylphosphonate--pyruvate transaminase [Acidaminococcus sp.]MCI2100207.1 2-aminoethylphosphonate--pyruvate transaminase [Acidaminococcus sp.]MCI2114526.1 2-aminoethylphosphonate--pyruvate transaminase [Acidaminococcus sp.]MCI2116470.1 2-aminoethylphosphonate--pyruvate transaminase [Acidaminococcus sp.]
MDRNIYKLLTPGPLTTTETVKERMLVDMCTWDEDYKKMTQEIRHELLNLAHADPSEYTTVLMQGSGTFGVESVLSSVIRNTEKVLILVNGAYSKRMCSICEYHHIPYTAMPVPYDKVPSAADTEAMLAKDPAITHIAMVHSETTTGILNDLPAIADVAMKHGKKLIVDAMSSFGGVDIDVPGLGITYLVSSANKCIQGVPGFSFIIARTEELKQTKGIARSLSLDLYDQWNTMEKDGGKWRFTSPTHVAAAFHQALKELKAEGGIPARNARYTRMNHLLRKGMEALGFTAYISEKWQGPIITTFFYPEHTKFVFKDMYQFLKDHGYVIYPGKLTERDTFRLGNIGEIYEDDVNKILAIFEEYMKKVR